MSHNFVFNDAIVTSDNWDDIYRAYITKLMDHGERARGKGGEESGVEHIGLCVCVCVCVAHKGRRGGCAG